MATRDELKDLADPHVLAEVVIDLEAIAHNVRSFVVAAEPAQVMVVVKADAYNHGMIQVARTAIDAGASQLGVATLREAMSLRNQGIDAPVTAWMWYPGEDLTEAFAERITVGVPSLAHAESLIKQIGEMRQRATNTEQAHTPGIPQDVPQVTLMFDSGLSRSGVGPREWEQTVHLLADAEREGTLHVTGLMSHLASADTTAEAQVTDLQATRFRQAIEFCRERGIEAPVNHLANTPATLARPDTHFEMVRPGVGVYGVDPVDPPVDADLKPAMTLRARVVTTRVVPAGEGVSYGLTWRAERDTRTAVVAMGYADGLPRSLSGNFDVSINGVRYQQIGRVCMDQIVVRLGDADLDPVPDALPGDWAVIFGEGGPSVEEFAQRAGTIPYEILTMPRCRVQRRHVPVAPAPEFVDFDANSSLAAPTSDAMREIGQHLGAQLSAGTVVVLTGPLGAGKTTLTQGIAEGMDVRGRVQSPTFTIVRTHKPGASGKPGLLHMDAYRLLGDDVADSIEPGTQVDPNIVLDALESLDMDADLDNNVLVAEWGRGVVELLGDNVLDVEISRMEGAELNSAADEVELEENDPRTVTWKWVKGGPGSAIGS